MTGNAGRRDVGHTCHSGALVILIVPQTYNTFKLVIWRVELRWEGHG
mgnify:CR=1 FL=1